MSRACAYCGKASVRMTREEVFPKFLVRAHPHYSSHISRSLPGLVLPRPHAVRDVCAACNSRTLSTLDTFAASFCRAYLRGFVQPGKTGFVRYDHHLLTRWILKVAYNSARSSGEPVTPFRNLAPYVLGETVRPPVPLTLFAAVIQADRCTEEERTALKSPFLYPRGIRVGTILLHRLRGASTFGVLMCVNSYIFVVLQWAAHLDRRERRAIATAVARRDGLTVLPEGKRTASIANSRMTSREYLSRNAWSPEGI